jgi:hypothetical protein
MHATCPNHCIFHLVVRLISVFGQEYKSWSSSLRNFLHLPVVCSLLGLIPGILFWNTLGLYSSHNIRDQVSHTQKRSKKFRQWAIIYTYNFEIYF